MPARSSAAICAAAVAALRAALPEAGPPAPAPALRAAGLAAKDCTASSNWPPPSLACAGLRGVGAA